MNNVARIAPEIRDIHVPAPLRDLPLWCVWAYEQHPNEPKPRKVPQYTAGGRRHGKQGSPEDLAKLTTFALARDAAARRGMDGVGFVLTRGTGIVALDFDNCVVDGVVNPVVANLVLNTYAEFSPSGKGVRAFFRGDLGNRKCFSKGHAFAVETFTSSGFVTVTGNMLPIVDILGNEDKIADVTPEVEQYCMERFGSAKPQAPSQGGDILDTFAPAIGLTIDESYELLQQLDPDMPRHDWMRVAMALSHEYSHSEEAFDLWNDWSSYGGSYPGYEGIRYQWDSLEGRGGFKPITMATVKMMAKEAGCRAPGLAADELRNLVEEETDKWPHSEGVRTPEGFTGKFPVHAAGDPILHQPLEWHIKGVIPKSDLIVLFGASGSGKSFIALDIVAAIARGVAWQGHRVTKAKAVIIAAEGAGAAGKRISAYCKRHNINEAELDLGIITVPPDVLKDSDIAELAKALKTAGADIFVIDTFAQVTPGANENSSEDMGLALANIRKITATMGATALVVHHAGKDAGRGARGWSGIRAAADAELEVSVNDSGRLLKITKMKDGEDNLAWGFRLNIIDLSTDVDGDPETSCVVEYVPAPLQRQKTDQPKGARQRDIMNSARECGAAKPEGALTREVIDACVKLIAFENQPSEGTKPRRDQRRDSVKRALDRLCEQGFLKAHNDHLYLPGVGPD